MSEKLTSGIEIKKAKYNRSLLSIFKDTKPISDIPAQGKVVYKNTAKHIPIYRLKRTVASIARQMWLVGINTKSCVGMFYQISLKD